MKTIRTLDRGCELVEREAHDQVEACWMCRKNFQTGERFIIHGEDGDFVHEGECRAKLDAVILKAWEEQPWD